MGYLKHELLAGINAFEKYFTETFDSIFDDLPTSGTKQDAQEWYQKLKHFRIGYGQENYPSKIIDCSLNPFVHIRQMSLMTGEKRGISKLYLALCDARRMMIKAETPEDFKEVKKFIKSLQDNRKKYFDEAREELELYYPLYREAVDEASKSSLNFKTVWQTKQKNHIHQLKFSKQ